MKYLFIYLVRLMLQLPMPQSIRDVLTWPIATRVLGKNFSIPVKLKEGFYMIGSMEDILARKIIFEGEWNEIIWEPITSLKLAQLAKESKQILIAGSHMGYMVLKAAHHTTGHVHAFEPVPWLYDVSLRNMALNPTLSSKITLSKAALGEREGELDLYVEDIRSSAIPYSSGHQADQRIEVPVTTIDEYAQLKNVIFDLILLDIEGFEWFALKGAEMTLEHKPKLILEISPKILSKTSITPEMILSKLTQMGYKVEYLDQEKDYSNIYATTT